MIRFIPGQTPEQLQTEKHGTAGQAQTFYLETGPARDRIEEISVVSACMPGIASSTPRDHCTRQRKRYECRNKQVEGSLGRVLA
jgi:hypothetical protein